MRLKTMRRLIGCAAVVGASAAVMPAAQAQTERFSATAVNISASAPAGATFVDITVERWSSDAERDQLIKALAEGGQAKLLRVLQDMPRVGYFRTPNSIAYDLKFARKEKLAEGGEQIVLGTDRYVSFWEAANRPRTIDYPFTLIDIRLGPDGQGTGKLSLATKVSYYESTNRIALENWDSQPVQLTQVRRVTN